MFMFDGNNRTMCWIEKLILIAARTNTSFSLNGQTSKIHE